MADITEIDLEALSLQELKSLQKSVEKAVRSFETRRLADARAKLEAYARELGVSLEDVVAAGPATSSRKVSAPKYRHPSDSGVTWSGRGRKPAWFTEAIAAGKTESDLLIG